MDAESKARAKAKEAKELVTDIRDAFDELGGVLIWKKQVVTEYDTLYKEVNNPEYVDYEMFGLNLKQVRKEELEQEGLDFRKTMKSYIDSSQFSDNKIEPDVEDRVFYGGILFEVVKINPLVMYDNNIFYVVFFCEATLSSQTDEYIEKTEKFFEIDNKKYEVEIERFPAELIGSKSPDYFVFDSSSNRMLIRADKQVDFSISIPEFDYTINELVEFFNSAFSLEYPFLECFNSAGKVGFRTLSKGKESTINILYIENLCYNEIGIIVGKYSGR